MQELKCCKLSSLLVFLYRYPLLKKLCWRSARFLEGGEFYSATMRKILHRYFSVKIGAYSYGTGMIPGEFPKGVSVGRYVSMAAGIKVYRRNHPYQRLSTHPFFYNAALGYVKQDTISEFNLTIGHDVWIGYGVIITPGCSVIANGAVLAAGAVVTKNVPAYAIVAGNPARVIKYRFNEQVIAKVEASHWWDKSIDTLLPYHTDFLINLESLSPEIKFTLYTND